MDPAKMQELEGKSSVELLSLIDSHLPCQQSDVMPSSAADVQRPVESGPPHFTLKDLLTAVRRQLDNDICDSSSKAGTPDASLSIKTGQLLIECMLTKLSDVTAKKRSGSSRTRKSSVLMLDVARELLQVTSCLAATASEPIPPHSTDSEPMLFMDDEVTEIVEVLASTKKRSRDSDDTATNRRRQVNKIQRISARVHDTIEWLVKRVYLYNNSQEDICTVVNVDDVVNCAWAPFQQLLCQHLDAQGNSAAAQEAQAALHDVETMFGVVLLPRAPTTAAQEKEGGGEASRSRMDQLADEASRSMSFVLLLDEGSRSNGSPTAASHLTLRRGGRVPSPETSMSISINTPESTLALARQQKQYSIPPPLTVGSAYQQGKPDLMLRPLDPNAISPPRSPLMMASSQSTFRPPIGRTPQTLPRKMGSQLSTPTTEAKQASGIPAYLLSKKKGKPQTAQDARPSFELQSTAIRNRSSGLVDSVYRNDELAARNKSKSAAVLAPATPPMKPTAPTPSEFLVDMPLFVDDDD